jgi:hypothetical protein
MNLVTLNSASDEKLHAKLLHVLHITAVNANNGKGKGFPLQAWSGSWGSRMLRLLDRLDIRLD